MARVIDAALGGSALETLLLIAAYDQLAAALDQLSSQLTCLLEVVTLSREERARIAKAYDDIETAVTSIEELLAFERTRER
jgi:hypothetical protein